MPHFSIVYHGFDRHVILLDLRIHSFERGIISRVKLLNMIIRVGISFLIHADQIFFLQLNDRMSKYQVLKSQFLGNAHGN